MKAKILIFMIKTKIILKIFTFNIQFTDIWQEMITDVERIYSEIGVMKISHIKNKGLLQKKGWVSIKPP